MKNLKLLCIALCTAFCLCTYNASGTEVIKSQNDVTDKTIMNNNVHVCIPSSDEYYKNCYKYDITNNIIDMYPILQYFTDNKAVEKKQYMIDELYHMHEILDASVKKYNSQLNGNIQDNSNKTILKVFENINDFIACAMVEERRNKVAPMWNTMRDMIKLNKKSNT